MNNTLQSLASDHEQIQSMNVEFLKKQQNQTNIIQENVEKLKVDVNETLRNYQIEQEEEINNYEILMKEQSENIQKVYLFLFHFFKINYSLLIINILMYRL